MPAPVGFRVLAARLLPEPVLLSQFDRPIDLAVVDVTLLRPEDVLSVREETQAAKVVCRIEGGWEVREAAVRLTI
jgi:hypothetical protein